jgi:tRNA(fMet)-specific endonuclease VapC
MPIIDTDLIIGYLRNQPNAVQTISEFKKEKIALKTTIFNVAELFKGAYLSSNVGKSIRGITDLLKHFEILTYTVEDAHKYGQISASLKKDGQYIGVFDELIASIVIRCEETLITRNLKHYSRIPRLSLQNWDQPS